jgi:plastocyanin
MYRHILRPCALSITVAIGLALAGSPMLLPVEAQSSMVGIQNYVFRPGTMTVPVGATVTWTNNDPFAHTTSSDSGVWDSGPLNPGASFSHTFTTAGVFSYHCHIHPFMQGTIVVGSAPPVTAPAVSVQPSTVIVGSTAIATGRGFTPANWAFAFWRRPDGTSHGIWVFTDGIGTFSFALGFAPRHGTGTELVTAFDLATGRWAPFSPVSVIPGPVSAVGQLIATINPVANGGTTTIVGSGFAPNSRLVVQWRRPDGTVGTATVMASATGTFALPFLVDPRHGCGPRAFTAFNLSGGMVSSRFVLNVVC